MNTIQRLIAVIFALTNQTVTIASERKAGNSTYYTLTGFTGDLVSDEVRVSNQGNLWSDRIPSFHAVTGELIRYETEIALRMGHSANPRLSAKSLRPVPAVIPAQPTDVPATA